MYPPEICAFLTKTALRAGEASPFEAKVLITEAQKKMHALLQKHSLSPVGECDSSEWERLLSFFARKGHPETVNQILLLIQFTRKTGAWLLQNSKQIRKVGMHEISFGR